MKSFVDRRGQGRTGSPTPSQPDNGPQPANSSRQQRALQAKINTNNLTQRIESPTPQRPEQDQWADLLSGAASFENPHSGPNQKDHRDRYDTENESTADTTGPLNIFPIPDSRRSQQTIPYAQANESRPDKRPEVPKFSQPTENRVNQSSYEGLDFNSKPTQSAGDHRQMNLEHLGPLQQRELNLQSLSQGDRFNGYSSYPTTTDGWYNEDDLRSEQNVQTHHFNNPPNPKHSAPDPTRNQKETQKAPDQTSLQQPPATSGMGFQQQTAALPSRRSGRQPLSQFQASNPPPRPLTVPVPQSLRPDALIPPGSPDLPPNYFRPPTQANKSIVQQPSSLYPHGLVSKPNKVARFDFQPHSATTIPSLEERPTRRESDPNFTIRNELDDDQEQASTSIIDYSDEILYAKPYTELHQESFDYNPREESQIIPDNLRSADLNERLAWLLKERVGPDHEQRFFNSLSIDDWEDAGSWFMGQFSDIMKRITDARRTKRKFAQDFEEKVKERNDLVDHKKARLMEAMRDMKSKGKEVLLTPSKPMQ